MDISIIDELSEWFELKEKTKYTSIIPNEMIRYRDNDYNWGKSMLNIEWKSKFDKPSLPF